MDWAAAPQLIVGIVGLWGLLAYAHHRDARRAHHEPGEPVIFKTFPHLTYADWDREQ